MARSNQNNYENKTITTQIVFVLRSHQVQELEDSINITYGILGTIFQVLDTENEAVMQIIICLAILSKKSERDIIDIVKKPQNFKRKTNTYLGKTQMPLKNYIQVSQGKIKKKGLLGMWVISAKI